MSTDVRERGPSNPTHESRTDATEADPYTPTGVILMNRIEVESIVSSHQFAARLVDRTPSRFQ